MAKIASDKTEVKKKENGKRIKDKVFNSIKDQLTGIACINNLTLDNVSYEIEFRIGRRQGDKFKPGIDKEDFNAIMQMLNETYPDEYSEQSEDKIYHLNDEDTSLRISDDQGDIEMMWKQKKGKPLDLVCHEFAQYDIRLAIATEMVVLENQQLPSGAQLMKIRNKVLVVLCLFVV